MIVHVTMKKALCKSNIPDTIIKINSVKHLIYYMYYLCEVSVRTDSFDVLFHQHVDSMKLEVVL